MKNQRIKININRTPLKSEDINNLQSFGSVLKGAKALSIPFYKKGWFWGAAGTACVAAIALVLVFNKPAATNTEAPKGRTTFIQPAMPGVEVEFASFEIESGKADILQMPTGTRVLIPACPFVDKDGKEISGKVQIRFREFRDPVDFAISGIPMTYDSAGQQYIFESAGMFEIQGYQNGQPIQVNSKCPVTVEQKPVAVGGKYNMYFLDTVKKNWEFKGKPAWVVACEDEVHEEHQPLSDTCINCPPMTTEADKVISSSPNQNVVMDKATFQLQNELTKLNGEIAKLKKQKPAEPRKANPSRPRFKLEFKATDFPELNGYKDVLFEVSKEDKKFTKEYYDVNWDKLALKELEPGVKYRLEMELYAKNSPTKQDRKESVIVMPVFEGKNYEEAMKNFKQKFKEYEKTLADKEAEQKRKAEEVRKANEELAKQQKAQQELWKQQRKEQEELRAKQQEQIRLDATRDIDERSPQYWNIRNSFAVENFGIYNSDFPYKQSRPSMVNLSFTTNGKEQNVDIMYQLIKGKNALMCNYYNGRCCNNSLTFKQEDRNVLFTVLPDGKLGYCNEQDFMKVPTSGNYKLNLTVSDKKFENVGEIKAFLGVGSNESKEGNQNESKEGNQEMPNELEQ